MTIRQNLNITPRHPGRLSLVGGLICLWLAASGAAQDVTFQQIRNLLEEAEAQRADVFSAGYYQAGKEAFNRAIQDSAAGRSQDRISKKLADARNHLERALTTAERLKSSFPELVSAYDDARKANAQTFAVESYEKGMGFLRKSVEKLEKDNRDDAAKAAERAVPLLRRAELEAIQAQVLGQVRELLAEATSAGGRELTPTLFAEAEAAVEDIEAYIEENRYDRETAARMAENANDILSHSIFLSRWISGLNESPGGWERLISQYEEDIKQISESLGLSPKFDRDMALNVEAIKAAIRSLQEDRRYLQEELAKRDLQIGELEAEVGKLASQSGKYMAELEARRQQIQAQKRFEEKIARITTLLEPDEGLISFTASGQTDEIVIRLTGLRFKSGSSDIRPEDYALLTKVQQVIREFPDRRIEIHGHTDSKGDEADNLKLSEDRARAVRDYLADNMNLSAEDMEVIGFGESRPLVSNDTAAGRIQNRRIEIVLRK